MSKTQNPHPDMSDRDVFENLLEMALSLMREQFFCSWRELPEKTWSTFRRNTNGKYPLRKRKPLRPIPEEAIQGLVRADRCFHKEALSTTHIIPGAGNRVKAPVPGKIDP
jgi:hypothetical protein